MDSKILKQIEEAIDLMNQHHLTHFQIESKGFSITLKKGLDGLVMPSPVSPAAAIGERGEKSSEAPKPSGEEINSPMVGTFYRKPSPDASPFVEIGTQISEGQTLCIIEAMKVMNEIKAEKSGKISEILLEDGNPVQFGDVLFRLG